MPNRAAAVTPRHVNVIKPADLAQFFATYPEHPERDVSEFNIVDLV